MATMKLRVRAATGGPTIRVQVPLFCSLSGLKDVVGPLISLPPSSFRLSLNKREEIEGPGTALLSSSGITSGDLLYYIVNPGGASGPVLQGNSPRVSDNVAESSDRGSRESRASIGSEANPRPARAISNPNTRRELCAAAAARRASVVAEQPVAVSATVAGLPGPSPALMVPGDSGGTGNSVVEGAIDVNVDEKSPDDAPGRRPVLIPDLLQRVLSSEIGSVRQASAYLVLAVHAVMLETGFVRVGIGDSQLGSEGCQLPSGWSSGGLVNLTYTLPELITSGDLPVSRASGEEAFLRCQTVGNVVVVYGAVTGGGVYRLNLAVSKFLRFDNQSGGLGVELLPPIKGDSPCSSGQVSGKALTQTVSTHGHNVYRDIFALWKEVKDGLSLPLLTVMCEAAGLPPPPSLLRLPTELKVKVLDSLQSVALANISCTCSELRFLAASEDLWKQRCREEFGVSGEKAPGGRGWKSAFVREFKHRKRREEERREAERRFRAEPFPPGIIFRPPSFTPHFGGFDYFQGLGEISRGALGSLGPEIGDEFSMPGGPSGNLGNRPGGWLDMGSGRYGVEGAFLLGNFDEHGGRSFPPVNRSRSRARRSAGDGSGR